MSGKKPKGGGSVFKNRDQFTSAGLGMKAEWPLLAGAKSDDAVALIQKERPDLKIVAAIPHGSFVPLRFVHASCSV